MKQKPYRFLLYLGLCLVQRVVLWIPRTAALAFGRGIARIAFFLLRREREKALSHLSLAYKDKPPQEIRKLAERVFIHCGEVGADTLRLPLLKREEMERWVEPGDGLKKIDRALSKGKGILLLSAHLGNWELMGAYLRMQGYEGVAVSRRLYYEKYNQALLDLRGTMTLRTIYQDASPREFLKVLQKNQILGILADQDIDWAEGIFVPFFGKPAYTLTAPVKLALASGAPIVPTFLVREGPGYRLLVEDPIHVEMTGSREETIREYTVRWSHLIEEKIREYPDQWAWMHRRWKTTPRSSEEGTKQSDALRHPERSEGSRDPSPLSPAPPAPRTQDDGVTLSRNDSFRKVNQ